MSERIIGNKGIELIRQFEGCELRSYRCPANVLTIGVGHTGPDVREGMTITDEQANDLLRKDLDKFEDAVNKFVLVPITQNAFDSLVSLAFNIGVDALRKSTLLRFLNAGEYQKAGDEFLRWNRAGGKVLAGLTRRRKAERGLFLQAGEVVE